MENKDNANSFYHTLFRWKYKIYGWRVKNFHFIKRYFTVVTPVFPENMLNSFFILIFSNLRQGT